MTKCQNCGTMNEDDSKYCSECGNELKKKKASVSVSHSTVSGDIYATSDGASPDGSSISIEHSAVMGNIIGKKEEHNYYGNTTIVKDDTKTLLTCSCCGKSILKSETVTCPSCGSVVCNDCFDTERKLCKKCIDERKKQYKEEFSQYDVIPVEVRKKLDSLKKQLKLNDEEVSAIENKGKTADSDDALSADEKRLIHDIVFGFFSNFKTIREIFREYGKDIKPKTPENLEWAYKKIESVYKKHPYNTEIAELYALFSATFSDLIPNCNPEKVSTDLPGKLGADVLYCSRHRDLPSAEKALNKLIETYDESDYELYIATAKIVYGNFMFSKTRQIDYLVMMEEGCNGVLLVDESTTVYLFYRLHRSLINEFDDSIIINRLKKNHELGVEDDERTIRKYADDGFASAQYIMGLFLLSYGNIKESIQLLKSSAEQGFSKAQVRLGDLYCEGKLIEKDYDEALSLYEEAYDSNNFEASERLGLCYYKGYGVEEDYDEAYEYLREAAENQVFGSYRELAELIVSGKDSYFDIDEAFKWYSKAVEISAYDKEAKKGLALCYLNGWGVESDPKKASEICPEVIMPEKKSKSKEKFDPFEIDLVDDSPKKISPKIVNEDAIEIDLVEDFPPIKPAKEPELSEAEKKYLKAAESGDATAQYKLGYCYKQGKGVSWDSSEAVKWFKKSAESGNADAQRELGLCYGYGHGVRKNQEKMIEWYKKAANQGDAEAQYYLGICFDNGEGVDVDLEESNKWYRKSAEQGYGYACRNLGINYYLGHGVSRDIRESEKWLKKASEKRAGGTKEWLSKIQVELDNQNKQECSEAEKKYLDAAKAGDSTAQLNLGNCYLWGQGANQDYSEAVYWFRKAADQGNTDAQNKLGVRYCNGQGVKQDYVEAAKWFRKAAEAGNMKAQCNLGGSYSEGQGVKQDYTEAVRWYKKAAEQGDTDSMYRLGICFERGQGVKKDLGASKKWLKKAAAQGNTSAQDWLNKASKAKVKKESKILSINSRFIIAVCIQAGIAFFTLKNILPFRFAPIISLSLCFLLFTYDLFAGKKRLFDGSLGDDECVVTLIAAAILIVPVNLLAIMVYRFGFLHDKFGFRIIINSILRAVLLLPVSVLGIWKRYSLPVSILGITDVFLLYSIYATSIDKDRIEILGKIIPILVMAWNIYLAVRILLG